MLFLVLALVLHVVNAVSRASPARPTHLMIACLNLLDDAETLLLNRRKIVQLSRSWISVWIGVCYFGQVGTVVFVEQLDRVLIGQGFLAQLETVVVSAV